MKIALVTLADDYYLKLTSAMITSFLQNNTWYNSDIIILDIGLSKKSKNVLHKIYKNIKYKTINKQEFNGLNGKISFEQVCKFKNYLEPKLYNRTYKLEVFNIKGYDSLLFIDSDCIILQNINELFDTENNLAHFADYSSDGFILNSGVMNITKNFIEDNVYNKLLFKLLDLSAR